MTAAIIGIDPGQKGGMAFLKDGVLIEYTVMPSTVKGIAEWISDIRDADNLIMLTERAQSMPKQGIAGAFNYGRHFGAFEAIALLLNLPYHEVPAGIWKRSMRLSKDKQKSIQLCERLFPEADLIPSGCKKQHDGIAEAILIAEYGRRAGLCQ